MTLAKVFACHLLQQWGWRVTTPAEFIQFPIRRIKDTYRLQFAPICPPS